MSFLLRTFAANGMSLREAGQWLGIRSWEWLRPDEVPVLAWVAQVSTGQLAHCLPLRAPRGPDRSYGLAGHRFRDAAFSKGHTARVCPTCVRRDGHARMSWSLRGVFGCSICSTLLLETCPYCKRRITWHRPAIDICKCGRYFRPAATGVPIPQHAHAWLSWIEERIAVGADASVPATDYRLPRLLSNLSLDGAIRLAEAFGLLEASQHLAQTDARDAPTLATVVERGLARLAETDGDLESVARLSQLIHQPALERLRADAATSADARCASTLLELFRSEPKGAAGMRGRYTRGQLTLFR